MYELIRGKILFIQITLGALNALIITGFAYLKIKVLEPAVADSKIIGPLEMAV